MKSGLLLLTCLFALTACKQEAPAEAALAAAPATETLTPSPVSPSLQPLRPSFDCAKAESEAEIIVCTDDVLAGLDNRLAEVYAAELAKPGAAQNLAASQRGWVQGRDECWKADDKKRCVEEEYRTRIAELQINSPDATAASAIEFKCNDGSKRLAMAYYNNLDDKPAAITLGDDQAIIFPQPAASGTKYGRKGITFWEHQGEALVDFFGIQLECAPVPPKSNP